MNEAQYYDNPYIWERGRYLENEGELRRFDICAGLIPNTVRTLLDVGAGNGAFLSFLESKGTPMHLVGLERSRVAVDRSLCKSEVRLGSVEKMPFESRSFDLVSAMEVIEHLPYGVYDKALGEIERVAGGYIMISVPYDEKRTRVQCPYCGCVFNPDYHMRSFDENTLSVLFESFRIVNLVKINRQDYLLGSQLRRAYRAISGRDLTSAFHRNTLCPQCGFSESKSPEPPAASTKATGVADTIQKVLPKQKKARWIVALYGRDGYPDYS